MEQYSVVGKRLPRIDGKVKVTGEARYTADIELPQMLAGKILRSPYPHAKILNIDASKAKRLPGVKGVITGKDTNGAKFGITPDVPVFQDQCAIAIDRVRYLGDEVASAAAIDEDIAEEALDLIKVEYEELPAVFDPEKAMEPGAPQLHDYAEKNINAYRLIEFGDMDKGFRESYYVRKDKFLTHTMQHAAMEPHASLGQFDINSGKLTLWGSKQDLYFTHYALSKTLGMPKSDIRLIKPHTGGGFGSKFEMFSCDFCASLLSKITGRPVKICYSREEVLTNTRRRHPMMIELKTGVSKEGTIIARQCKIIANTGAYASTGPVAIYLGSDMLATIYKPAHLHIDAYSVYTNTPVCGAMRGHGATQPLYANDVHLDLIAKEIGIDPVELRLRNVYRAGDKTPMGTVLRSCDLKECIEKTAETVGWKEKRGKFPGKRGLGMGTSTFISGANVDPNLPFSVTVNIHHDGKVSVFTGACDIGQGAETMVCQIAAEELGIGLEDIRITAADTDVTPVEPGSYSSRVTFMTGNATKRAAANARQQLLEIAAKKLEANIEDLEARNHRIYVKGSPERGISYSEVVRVGYEEGKLPIFAQGQFSFTELDVWQPWVPGQKGDQTPAYSFGAQVAEVEVDPETGKIKILDMAGAHDCGRAINPMAVEGQLEGSTVSGVGYGLFEQLLHEGGQTLNPSFLEYKLPTSVDIPERVTSIIVESNDPRGPYGAKEAGEGTIISPTPAIANAINDALGMAIYELPITPEKIMEALEK